ncbi:MULTISPECIES: helix-turn-helix domain-containing protein [Micromonospora]|uniref:ATP-binding protein n=1 Tax=Micromonospora solifontis TaxID=2487138 RepID=A0ABX9WKX3_9ACTN|nr:MULTISPECIES: ATP-binding protein [Micromonospora]NES14605.1 ATP-binding protein [Micromonospora sp. PPF5-17B]NES35257.1 ATP-binding protein [Micromonospora solifontis]RNM00984.1 ATP-binding protein [Micromonospora solifontis]
MPTLRNRRLEQLLGGPIDETLTYAQVKGLIPDTTEGPDLDFKRDTYTSSDRDRKALCGDVGALANANGGILILGMDEDNQGRAANDTGVTISDDERRRLRQTVVANVHPTPTFDIIPVEDPDRPGTGFLIIWIAQSATAPHAYVNQNKSLLYPKRIGTETIWLSEAEVAEAYRARFAGFTDRIEETARIEADFLQRLSTDEMFLVVTLVPDLPGSFTIDTAALNAFQLSNANQRPAAFGIPVPSFARSTVRRRCLVGTASYEPNKPYSRGACELHENGTGVFAEAVDRRMSGDQDGRYDLVDAPSLTVGVGAALGFLARHARDRAAAGGLATVRATIWPVTPIYLGEQRLPVKLVSSVGDPNEELGTHVLTEPPVADAVADIDDLCADGPGLVAATYRLASDLYQAFGAPEVPALTPDGAIRLSYWYRPQQAHIVAWAEEAGVEVLRQ